MRSLNLLQKFNEKFSVKVFTIIITFIIIISTTFTAFFTHWLIKSQKAQLIKEGEILAKLLSYNSRLGVFSENNELLKDPIEGILQQDVVLEVSIFDHQGRLLEKQQREPVSVHKETLRLERKKLNEISNEFKNSQYIFYEENKYRLKFWAPVIAGSGYSTEESLFFEEGLFHEEERIIGFVSINLDKKMLNKKLKSVLFFSILIGIIFLVIGSVATYFVTNGITRPLKRLTESVKALGIGGSVEKISIETKDEIGKLAIAFNDMYESLKKRETEKEQLEEQLRHAQKMEAIGTLAGGIAHDFNNYLTAIIGYGNLLQMKLKKNTKLSHHVEQILASGEKAANLSKNLLAFSRKQIIELKPIDCNEVIKNVKKLLVRIIGEDIEFKVKLSKEDLIVMADAGQIEQVIFNLITNARDAMPGGGILTITTEAVELDKEFLSTNKLKKAGRYALITFSDVGIGMDDKTLVRIFDPFFTTKEVGKGTGLGLSMVYGIIKQHDGYIDVSSQANKGTEFRIYLPLIDLKVEDKKAKSLAITKGGTETVLIAEDDEDIKKLVKYILKQSGYKVIEAVDGEDAVKKFTENNEDIRFLIFDVIMPKKNGKEAYEEIKKVRPDIKALFISGYAHDIIHSKGVLEEGINFITKPVSPDKLLKKIREVLDK